MGRPKKVKEGEMQVAATTEPTTKVEGKLAEPEVKMVQISEDAWNKVQEKLKMLTEVADKGRVFNYENAQPQKKAMKVHLSLFDGKIIIGWRTLLDELVKHPTTGVTVGEKQQYEILLLDKEGKEGKLVLDGYDRFSSARYNERILAEIVGKKENWDGGIAYDVRLDDGRVITLDARFLN